MVWMWQIKRLYLVQDMEKGLLVSDYHRFEIHMMKINFHKLFTHKLTGFFYAGPMFYPDMENMPGDDGEWMIF